MKQFNWNTEKNQTLIAERGISFEDILFAIQSGDLLDDVAHPNPDKYSNQRMFVVDVDNYVYLVPYVEISEEIFLKTIIPSRKATKHYLRGGHD
ncbi:MAG: BrnT family toxin [Methylococcaceae bacterium]|nr:BrnT family toxin [Methylococcaceae bacterium]